LTIQSSSAADTSSGRTEVLYGEQNVVNTVVGFTSRTKRRIDACVDYTRPSLAIEIEQLKKAFLDAKNRGVRLRYVTEITEHNVRYCKELLKVVDELRHIDGIKGNFYLSETEYIAPARLHKKGKPASQIIYSNVKEIIEHQQNFVFDSFWSRAIPAEQRIKEIEEGIVHYETKVLENKEQISSHMKSVIEKASERSVVSSIGGMQLVYNNFFEEYKKIIYKQRKGEGKGVRWITSIDKDNVSLVNIFLDAGIQIRHLKNLTPMNFAVDDRYFYATIDNMEKGNFMRSLLISNEPAYIKHYNSFFETIWKNGVDAIERIKDIETGVDLADIEVIPSSVRTQELYLDIVKTALEEILLIFPTINSFIRQEKIGAIRFTKEAAKERNVKVRILVPADSSLDQKVQQLKGYCPGNIDIRYIVQMSETKATILVVDRKASLVMELRDDRKTTFVEAIGLSTYSNSKAGVSSYVAIFENLWRQAELYEQLKEAHEQLKVHDKIQNEFINVAAHELRTPIQPILGLTAVLHSRKNNMDKEEQWKLLDVIRRNANRLQRLTEDILDVTKIESQSLKLNKEQFDLNEVVSNTIADYKNELKEGNSNIKLELVFKGDEGAAAAVLVEADKARLSQVIANILGNAIKFTKEGCISIVQEVIGSSQILISIKDTGSGIDPEIMPRLFTKFATKSQKGGTGLGLFISKGIIEAHNGRIWAENNTQGKGATFHFSLPISKKSVHNNNNNNNNHRAAR
jgi:two-component system, OmpR family, sensor histidine kinase VicK